jgi:ribosomal protein S18 acetylase RimI-like enzyme
MKAFVALDASRHCVGLANVIFHMSGWLEQPSCYLQDLFVSPSARKQGVGRALLEHVTSRVKEAGGARVHWLTKENNYRARALYDTFADGNAPNGFIQYAKKVI